MTDVLNGEFEQPHQRQYMSVCSGYFEVVKLEIGGWMGLCDPTFNVAEAIRVGKFLPEDKKKGDHEADSEVLLASNNRKVIFLWNNT